MDHTNDSKTVSDFVVEEAEVTLEDSSVNRS
ncbi:hypothetical protein KSP9073_00794 [Kushneria phyllosphaerae]|uniref:Uncharacterized protein n=1 Tax=Kushneria phyllosphaerae TaxID=2100822 RepID=A0A2R8CIV0_9GAMM|nr:hypothetical protein KSP9073_00794 [Kushneria phyllosphaerae]